MSNPVETLQAGLKALRKVYLERLPEKIEEIEKIWNSLQANNNDEALKALHLVVHRLNGSGATYGFKALSDRARILEGYLNSIIENKENNSENNNPLLSIQVAEIDNLVAQLRLVAFEPAPTEIVKDLVPLISTQNSGLPEPVSKLVYLLEDESNQVQDLALQIEHFSYDTATFAQLTDLVAAIEQTSPAALILHVKFSEDNLVGAKTIAEIQKSYGIPSIFISEVGDLNARLQAVRAGAKAYYTTPLDINSLIDQLDTLIADQTQEPYRILIIDDEPTLANLYALALQQAGMTTEISNNPLRVMQPLSEFNPDLILMDVYMPYCNGLELAAVIRQQEAYVSIPIVFLSTETSMDKQLAAMRLGGDDFLTKPIQLEHLISSVNSRAQRSRILRSFMTRDSLTGLLNHTKTKEYLDLEVARAQRRQSPLVFAMLDIDHFKAVNDTYGHPTGDRVIKNLARLLQQRLRKTDIIGRYGGEEFAVILLDTDGSAALQALDRVRSHFAQIRQHSENGEFSVSFSCGLATFPNYSSATALNDAADRALYKAKRGGRNQVVLAT
ncbi:MAG: diguanylate cyclase [Chloroflexota bacterium]|nr:diguanylate cyclase [Chloroflexota bacterium]